MTAPILERPDRLGAALDGIIAPLSTDKIAAAVAALAPEPLPQSSGPPPSPPRPPAPPTTGGDGDGQSDDAPAYIAALRVVAARAADLRAAVREVAAAEERFDSALDILLAAAARDTNPNGSPT